MLESIKNIDHSQAQQESAQSKFILSNLTEFYKQDAASPYSVKLVTKGVERYKINNQPFKLEANNYLIVNKSSEVEVSVQSEETVKGICIYPPEELINEVFLYKTKSANELLDSNDLSSSDCHFTPKNYRIESTHTGRFLTQQLPFLLQQNTLGNPINFDGFYLQMAEHLVEDQLMINQQLSNLCSVKKQTKEELFRRVSLAREYMESNFTRKITVEELATTASLSKYHFLRVFKEIFHCTPYQFILNLKLIAAEKFIQNGHSYNRACEEVGFSDPKNLRKALKSRN